MSNFLTYGAVNPMFAFSIFHYDHLLVNKNERKKIIGKITDVNVFFYTKLQQHMNILIFK
jgi:hypothetical protein